MKLTINPDQPFSFRTTIFSHGWVDLPPFRYDLTDNTLAATTFLQNSCLKLKIASNADANIIVHINEELSAAEINTIRNQVVKMFRLGENFVDFYTLAARYKKYNWIAEQKVGRMFRCWTVWEDMVKMLCTTNCNWAMTKLMVGNLVNKLGNGCFPTPEMVSGVTEKFLREEIKLGYRSEYLLEFSRKTVNGQLNPENFETWTDDGESLYQEIRKIKGFGHYAASGLLKLLGHYSFIGSDSWSRKKFSEKYGRKQACSEVDIMKYYRHLGEWRGLFFWLDMTREWYEKIPAGI
jgi:N-glycosylase/DNA lyase